MCINRTAVMSGSETLNEFVSLFFCKSRCRSCIWRLGRGPKSRRASIHSLSKTNRKSQRKQRSPKTRTARDVLQALGVVLTEYQGGHAAERIAERSGAAHDQHPAGDGLALSGAAVRVGAAASRDSAGVCARVAAAPKGNGASSQRLHGRSHCPHARQAERTAVPIRVTRQGADAGMFIWPLGSFVFFFFFELHLLVDEDSTFKMFSLRSFFMDELTLGLHTKVVTHRDISFAAERKMAF